MSPIVHGTKVNRRRRPLAYAGSAVLAVTALARLRHGLPRRHHGDQGGERPPRSTSPSTAAEATARRPPPDRRSPATGPLAYSPVHARTRRYRFPDPKPGGGFAFETYSNIVARRRHSAAQAKCQKLLPTSGPLGSGLRLRSRRWPSCCVSPRCMRAHGVHQFPDPFYSRPAHFTPGEYQEITDFDGASCSSPRP